MMKKEIKNTILIVDDEVIVKKSLEEVLKDEYSILQAENGEVALNMLAIHAEKIVAIVLDMVMPVMDGLTFLEHFRNYQEYNNIPVIVATSNDDEGVEKKCLEYGVWDFVMKPYNPFLLQFRIKNVIDKSRMLMSERDPVTGLYTKLKFYQKVRHMLAEVVGEKFAFVRIDIDRFKMINNFYGIQEGDKVLMSIAKELIKISAVFDYFVYARLENDVFACCLPYKEENIEILANDLQLNLKKVNKDYNIKVSCGVYVINDYNMDVSEMYDRAYLAAKSCKGKFVQNIAYYDESMIEDMRQEQFVINAVNKAIEEEQFVVYLQPKINLITGKPYGAEALVRWMHPKRGMIAPAEFIPVYERNGIIGRLDQYMWRKVCALLRKWIDEGKEPDPISVNVSRVNIYNPHLVEILNKIIIEYRIPPQLLNLEITESAFMEDQSLVMRTVKRLHDLGFKIMMDDFGSGYSSLNVLKDMDVDYLKIDMKFLQEEKAFNGKGEKVLTSVVRMAKWLQLPSIVEGVETEEQVDFLKCIGCEYAQGFYYAKPMSVVDYEMYIAREQKKEEKVSRNENSDMINELWNTRSSVSVLFDALDVPISVYEYRNDKIELLRSNELYEKYINIANEELMKQEAAELRKIFKSTVIGNLGYEHEISRNLKRYHVLAKILGQRENTWIIMVTYLEILNK
ncbi:MAG: EAL domain-containing protein [Lachnospiraceae bacterium]|nr:EAL domain-containing protein [Lachnospiraceae bacterium]